MTSRTACARRKTWASWVCLRKVSQVGRASSGKWSLRVRTVVASRQKYYKHSPDTWHMELYYRNNAISTQMSLELLYGVIYAEGQVIKRGTYALSAPRAGP